jgi:hypothetical protein
LRGGRRFRKTAADIDRLEHVGRKGVAELVQVPVPTARGGIAFAGPFLLMLDALVQNGDPFVNGLLVEGPAVAAFLPTRGEHLHRFGALELRDVTIVRAFAEPLKFPPYTL